MGKIYTYAELEQGLVPKPSSFSQAKKQTLESLSSFVNQGEISGAMAFGSVAKGSPSERSDFDLLVITENGTNLTPIKAAFDEVYQDTKVAVEPIIIPRELAEHGFHTMDKAFYFHLKQIPPEGNIVGTPPLDIMKPFDLPLSRVHEQYLIQKLRRLREGIFTYSITDEYRVLQRALEAPVNTGRRTLQALYDIGALDNPLENDSKASVITRFKEVFAGTQLLNGYDSIISSDRGYTNLLMEALSGNTSRNEYEQTVSQLVKESIPQAIDWVSEVSKMYVHLLEKHKSTIEGQIRPGNKERYL